MSDDLKARLFAPRVDTPSGLPEDDVEVPGVGVVRIRGLNRIEAIHVQNAIDPAESERRALALGMVDPPLTEAEVGRWQKAAIGGEMNAVAQRITELSGMAGDSGKEAYKSVRGEPDDGVRVLPGAEAGDDGSPAEGGDQ